MGNSGNSYKVNNKTAENWKKSMKIKKNNEISKKWMKTEETDEISCKFKQSMQSW